MHQYILQCVGGGRESIYEILLPWSVCKGEERMSREAKYWFENNSKWFMKHFNRLRAENLFFIPPPFWQVNFSELVIDGL